MKKFKLLNFVPQNHRNISLILFPVTCITNMYKPDARQNLMYRKVSIMLLLSRLYSTNLEYFLNL